jgi:hypothetical protein
MIDGGVAPCSVAMSQVNGGAGVATDPYEDQTPGTAGVWSRSQQRYVGLALFNPQASEYTFRPVTAGSAGSNMLLAFNDGPQITNLSPPDVAPTNESIVINGMVYKVFKDLTPDPMHFPVNLDGVWPSMQAAPPQGTSWLGLFIDWPFSWGERHRQFGPDEPITGAFRSSPAIDAIRREYCEQIASGGDRSSCEPQTSRLVGM